jgi:hypothetical protein
MPDASSDAGGPHLEAAEQPVVETPPATTPDAPLDPRWWGAVTLGIGELARWRAGPSTVHAERRTSDWRVWHATEPDAYAVAAERVLRVRDDAPEGAPTLRFTFAETPDTITVKPLLADRPVVVRPESSLTVPPGERVVLYVSSPAWMALKLEVRRPRRRRSGGQPQAVVLAELPTYRPSDTWFGPSTRVGQLCYAVRTAARLELAALPLRPHRVVTPVTVDNQAATPLELARVSVPMPHLALHVDRVGRLWSDGVLFTREPDDDTTVRVTPFVPQGGERLAEPRNPQNLGQALSATLGRLLKGDVR